MTSLLARFVAANRRIARSIEEWLPPVFVRHLHTLYKFEVAELINRRRGQVILDIGGGKDCPFLPFVRDPSAHLIVAFDCAEEELRGHNSLPHKIVGDAAAQGFPFRDQSADLVVSRSVVEHIHNNTVFFGNCARVLRPGGIMIHTFPGKFAPFSLLNRILPNWLARRLLALFHADWAEDCGFIAYYDQCYFVAIRRLLEQNGFRNSTFVFRYYQSIYFDFFLPLYLIILIYDLVISFLGIRNLACGILLRAEAGDMPAELAATPVEDPAADME